MLIIIDGIDGAGKTTQTALLAERLKKDGYQTATLDFPQYQKTFFGKMVSRFLKGEFGNSNEVNPYFSSLLYALDRYEAKLKLLKWLKEKKIVILNRYVTANLIHQSIKVAVKKRAAFIRWVERTEYQILGLPKPDLVIYLSLPYTLACALIEKRGNTKDIHEADVTHLKNAALQGMRLTKRKKNWHAIQCSKGEKILSKKEIGEQIWRLVRSNLTV